MPLPPTVLLYGPSGIGKTLCALNSVDPARTAWIEAERGAIQPAWNFDLNTWRRLPAEIHTAISPDDPDGEMLVVADRVCASVRAGRIGAIVLDPITSYASRALREIRKVDRVPDGYGKAAQELDDEFRYPLWKLLASGALVIAIAHEADPTTIDGKSKAGGPSLYGKLGKLVRHEFDIVLRCAVRAGPTGAPMRCFVHNSLDQSAYPTKDRFGVVADLADGAAWPDPMDLRVVLRNAIRRQRGLPIERVAVVPRVGGASGDA